MLSPIALLAGCALGEELPAALGEAGAGVSTQVLDRDGQAIREVRSSDGKLSSRVTLAELSPAVVPALLAAEDARFYRHPGVDPIAMLRAFGQALWQRRLVSGASTLTQQLARALIVRPRTARGKWRELAVALRIEASLSKQQILVEYLNRVEFGPNLRGIDAASRHYFDKPAAQLDLARPRRWSRSRAAPRCTIRRAARAPSCAGAIASSIACWLRAWLRPRRRTPRSSSRCA